MKQHKHNIICRSSDDPTSRSIKARFAANSLNPEHALNYLLHISLHGQLPCADEVREKSLWCPEWNMSITPSVEQITEQSAVLNFHLAAPQWGKTLFECSVAMGSTPKQALGVAAASFLFSFMQGLGAMEQRQQPYTLMSTSFAGHIHHWRVYASNIVGLGDNPALDENIYWHALQEGISQRLGNQKLCYAKVYAAKSYGSVIGECRIDDIKSEELSALVAQIAEKWTTKAFASQKMFFFIRQEEATTLPYPYWGEKGCAQLKEAVRDAALLFRDCQSQKQYEQLPERLKQAIADPVLAAECFAFLPEICAENAFDKITYPEAVDIQIAGQAAITVWKNQLTDYWPIHNALFELFEENAFGEDTMTIYQNCINVSAIYGVIAQIQHKENAAAHQDASIKKLRYQTGADFIIR